MLRSFDTISALCYTLIKKEHADAHPVSFVRCNATVRFVSKEMQLMPDFLRMGMLVLTLLFSSYVLVRKGCPFHHLPDDQRWALIQSWKHSRIGVRRDFIRFYESLSVLAWFAFGEERS